jgi:hypothetical protein
MRRVMLIGAIGALLLAMMIPGIASAALPKWWNDISRAACTNTGGHFGFGKVVLSVDWHTFNDWEDPSIPSPNYIVVNTLRQEKVNGAWVTVAHSSVQSATYPDGYSSIFSQSAKMAYSFPSAVHPPTRIIMRAGFWDDLATDVRLKKLVEQTSTC